MAYDAEKCTRDCSSWCNVYARRARRCHASRHRPCCHCVGHSKTICYRRRVHCCFVAVDVVDVSARCSRVRRHDPVSAVAVTRRRRLSLSLLTCPLVAAVALPSRQRSRRVRRHRRSLPSPVAIVMVVDVSACRHVRRCCGAARRPSCRAVVA